MLDFSNMSSKSLNDYIRETYREVTDKELAELLNLTPKAVKRRREKMGLKRSKALKEICYFTPISPELKPWENWDLKGITELVTEEKWSLLEDNETHYKAWISRLDPLGDSAFRQESKKHKDDNELLYGPLRDYKWVKGEDGRLTQEPMYSRKEIPSRVEKSSWQVPVKNKVTGELEVKTLSSERTVVTNENSKSSNSPKWPVCTPAGAINVSISIFGSNDKENYNGYKESLILTDTHFGYRILDTGSTSYPRRDPMHDDKALDIFINICSALQPDEIIHAGDIMDFASYSKYAQESSFHASVQPALDMAYLFFKTLREVCPKVKIIALEGNHDARLWMYIAKNAISAFGLKRANIPESFPVLSIPHLLRFEELDIQYLSGYPNNEYWINEKLKVIHGSKLDAKKVADDAQVSVIQGHAHRIQVDAKTRKTKGGYDTNFAFLCPAMSRTDGCLPGHASSLDVHGVPMQGQDGWQKGFMSVYSTSDGKGEFQADNVHIQNNRALFRGKVY